MQVLLLATDEKPKLPPLSDTIAAPMVPIVNRPVMAGVVEILARAGYKQLMVSLCHRGGSIASYFGSGSRWGVQIEYLTQREPWGSAGALRWAGQLLVETTLVVPADMVLDLDVDAALAAHRAQCAGLTLILHAPRDRGIACPVPITVDGRVMAGRSPAAGGQLLDFTGAFICEPQIMTAIPPRTSYDVYEQLMPALLEADTVVYGYQTHGYWNPLASFQSYQEAQRVFLYSAYQAHRPEQETLQDVLPRVRYPSIEGQQIAPGIWIGSNHIIHPSARLAPPVFIGEGCRIGREVELGPEVVIGSDVVVDDEATIQASIILDHTYVGNLVNIHNRAIRQTTMIDIRSSESAQIVDPFLLSATNGITTAGGRWRRRLATLVALLLLLVTLPLILLIGLVVFITSGGHLFERLPRVGRRASATDEQLSEPQPIDLLAFRTQRPDGTWSLVGGWLHRYELDRLPELWNVVRGDLALVGVKPLHPAEAVHLVEAWQQKRYESPAGFTGLWYIQTKPGSSLDSVLIADAYYVAIHTWRDDLKLLLRTPIAWLQRMRSQPVQFVDNSEYYGQVDNVSGT